MKIDKWKMTNGKSKTVLPQVKTPEENRTLTAAIDRSLESGSVAVLVTLIEESSGVGNKLLINESGSLTGSLGDEEMDRVARDHATKFLESREEARLYRLRELSPTIVENGAMRLLFERIEPEPVLVICGAGHVGASLARLAGVIGYTTRLID